MLRDTHERAFPYIRLSITDVCNFRCSYCLPDGYQSEGDHKDFMRFMSFEEIERLVSVLAHLGVSKIRLTGGEPTLRKDFTDIARMIASYEGIEQTTFTTNAYRLADHVEDYYEAGLKSVNISIDSLQRDNFKHITGVDKYDAVMRGLERALDVGMKVKINTVLLKGLNDHELDDFIAFSQDKDIAIRFIELMQTGDNEAYFKRHHLSADIVRHKLEQQGWVEQIRAYAAGPAIHYHHSDYAGQMGIIAPYSKDFCKSCNRLRITARGDLRLCLFGEFGIALRPLLQSDDQRDELIARIEKQLRHKKESHFLHDGNTGMMTNLSSTGG